MYINVVPAFLTKIKITKQDCHYYHCQGNIWELFWVAVVGNIDTTKQVFSLLWRNGNYKRTRCLLFKTSWEPSGSRIQIYMGWSMLVSGIFWDRHRKKTCIARWLGIWGQVAMCLCWYAKWGMRSWGWSPSMTAPIPPSYSGNVRGAPPVAPI